MALLGLCSGISYSQIIQGLLADKESGQPVPFANIGIIDRNYGTCSDVGGGFAMELTGKPGTDLIRISCIGYDNLTCLVSDLRKEFLDTGRVRLELTPRTYQLKEVTVRPLRTKRYTLGNFCDPDSPYGNAFYSSELGTEMGVIIRIPARMTKCYLRSIRFYVGECTFDAFPVRLNIYSLKDGKPDENILRESIFVEITASGEYIVDLLPYRLFMQDDFFISLEYYRIADLREGSLTFCAVSIPRSSAGNGYFRMTSQGRWKPEPVANTGLSVEVECER